MPEIRNTPILSQLPLAKDLPDKNYRGSFRPLGGLLSALSAVLILAIIGYIAASRVFSERLIPGMHRDAYEFIWTIWWQRYALTHGLPLFFTHHLFFPDGASLYLHATSELLTLPAVLLFPTLDPLLLYSSLCLLALSLNFLAGVRLFEGVTESALVARLFAFLFALHPFFLAHLDGGHLNFLCFFPVLVFVDRALRWVRSSNGTLANSAWMGIAIGSLIYLNPYYFYFALLSCVPLGVTFGALRSLAWEKVQYGVPLFLGITALLAAPKILPMLRLFSSGMYTPNHDPLWHSADVVHLLLPGSHQAAWVPVTMEAGSPLLNDSETGLYLGFTVLGILVFTAAKRALLSSAFRATFCAALNSMLFLRRSHAGA